MCVVLCLHKFLNKTLPTTFQYVEAQILNRAEVADTTASNILLCGT